jgi:hypothetical protein
VHNFEDLSQEGRPSRLTHALAVLHYPFPYFSKWRQRSYDPRQLEGAGTNWPGGFYRESGAHLARRPADGGRAFYVSRVFTDNITGLQRLDPHGRLSAVPSPCPRLASIGRVHDEREWPSEG